MALGKPLEDAILDGAREIALPAFVSTLCICIVFVPMFSPPVWPGTFLCRSPRQWCSPCWPATC